MDRSEIKRIVKEIQDQKDVLKPNDLLNLLNKLKSNVVATEDTLRETKVGLTVGRLRQYANKDVADLAKEIVKKWKSDVDDDKQRKVKAKPGTANDKKAAAAKPSTSAPVPSGPRSWKADGVQFETTGDKVRDASRGLVYDGLVLDSGAPIELVSSRASAIEQFVYQDNGSATTAAYRQKMRSLYLNSKANPALRESVVSGDLPVAKFCTMAPSEMASEERKAKDQQMQEQNLAKLMGAGEQQAETDAFQCGRCKQRKTIYRQAQTRSADEPMTTFVTCVNCNNRWKFS